MEYLIYIEDIKIQLLIRIIGCLNKIFKKEQKIEIHSYKVWIYEIVFVF